VTSSGTGSPNRSLPAQGPNAQPAPQVAEKSGVHMWTSGRLLAQGMRIGRMASRRSSALKAVATSASG